MRKIYPTSVSGIILSLAVLFCLNVKAWATDVHVDRAGTLQSLLATTETTLKITGSINGTDVKYLRTLVKEGKVTSLDLSEVSIVSGGSAYADSYTTANDIIGEDMFRDCTKLRAIKLPSTVTEIQSRAFSGSGLQEIDIPNSVSRLGGDAFAYCNSLATVTVGRRVSSLGQGVFYSSPVKKAYIKPLTPSGTPAYLFSSNPSICVYTKSLEDYKKSSWSEYGKITGGLEELYPLETDSSAIVNKLRGIYFEDDACTCLKAEYSAMSDKELSDAMKKSGMPSFMVAIALKIKNNEWGNYEKDFRIHSYKAYSDASYWNNKMKSTGGSYMGNPTGIYANSLEPLYVFVEGDVPADATLYIAGCVGRDLISGAKSGTCLSKGVNIVEVQKNALYYILYTADTKSMTKSLDEWPEIKIHIQGGVVNGYYDVARKSNADYVALLKAATHELFTVKSTNAIFNFQTSAYREVWPKTIDKSISWFDSLTVWQQELMGYRESVASGKRNFPPYNLAGGEAIAPRYYNNPNFAIQGGPDDAGYANSSYYRTCYNSVECINNSFNVSRADMDEWCAGHECGHNNQGAINLEGGTEVSNNLFSNVGRFLFGRTVSTGNPLSTVMTEYADRTPFFVRDVNSQLRMYYQLYLYYHQAQKNTSFFPNLFKALREDPLVIWGNSNNSSLKFVRKVCEVAQEDLTDFFTAWGFFIPFRNLKIEDYGEHTMTVTQGSIDRTLAEIAKYPKKNRTILFIEDRVEDVLTSGDFATPGQKRRGSEIVGQCGDLGQFTDYFAGASEPGSYTYIQSDSLFCMKGTGGIGFLVLDKDSNFVYASNALNFCIPARIGADFRIYSVDADGTLHETFSAGEGTQYVTLSNAGTLGDSLTTAAIKAVISGPLNGTDIRYMRTLINGHDLSNIDLRAAKFVSGGLYYKTYKGVYNAVGTHAFYECHKLTNIVLPEGITRIESNAFANSGLSSIVIPESVTELGKDAFAYCKKLATVTIGSKVKNLSQGVFYSSPVKDVYVAPLTPPETPPYLFSSNPVIHVYAKALSAYKASGWAEYGTIVGDLDNYTSVEQPVADTVYDEKSPVYDMFGRVVTQLQPGVIYVRSGKKFIAK